MESNHGLQRNKSGLLPKEARTDACEKQNKLLQAEKIKNHPVGKRNNNVISEQYFIFYSRVYKVSIISTSLISNQNILICIL